MFIHMHECTYICKYAVIILEFCAIKLVFSSSVLKILLILVCKFLTYTFCLYLS